jgi:hypothetical protein
VVEHYLAAAANKQPCLQQQLLTKPISRTSPAQICTASLAFTPTAASSALLLLLLLLLRRLNPPVPLT